MMFPWSLSQRGEICIFNFFSSSVQLSSSLGYLGKSEKTGGQQKTPNWVNHLKQICKCWAITDFSETSGQLC